MAIVGCSIECLASLRWPASAPAAAQSGGVGNGRVRRRVTFLHVQLDASRPVGAHYLVFVVSYFVAALALKPNRSDQNSGRLPHPVTCLRGRTVLPNWMARLENKQQADRQSPSRTRELNARLTRLRALPPLLPLLGSWSGRFGVSFLTTNSCSTLAAAAAPIPIAKF